MIDTAKAVSLTDYQALSGYKKNYQWRIICDAYKPCKRKHLQEIKSAINNQNLVVFGMILHKIEDTGATLRYYPKLTEKSPKMLSQNLHNNVFAFTQEVYQCAVDVDCRRGVGGHEMFIYGYAENEAIPGDGIFYIRNSWSKQLAI